jgi:hypothetical protein
MTFPDSKNRWVNTNPESTKKRATAAPPIQQKTYWNHTLSPGFCFRSTSKKMRNEGVLQVIEKDNKCCEPPKGIQRSDPLGFNQLLVHEKSHALYSSQKDIV